MGPGQAPLHVVTPVAPSLHPTALATCGKRPPLSLKLQQKSWGCLSLVWVGLYAKPRANHSGQEDVALSLANMSYKPLTRAEDRGWEKNVPEGEVEGLLQKKASTL